MNTVLLIIITIIAQPQASWSEKELDGVKVFYMPQSERFVESIIPSLESERERVAKDLQVTPPQTVKVVVAPDLKSFSQVQKRPVPPWVSGTAYPGQNMIVLRPLAGHEVRHSSIQSVIAHEYTHILLHEKLGDTRIPKWLDEGLSVHMANESLYARAEKLIPIAITGRYIPFRQIENEFPYSQHQASIAYAQSEDFINYLINEHGHETFMLYLDKMAAGEDPDDALYNAYEVTLFDLETKWLEKTRRTYIFLSLGSGGGLLWFLMSVLAIVAYGRKAIAMKKLKYAEYGYDEDSDLEIDSDDNDDEGPESYLH
jgi:peptidase MA superfamily protein